MQVGHDRPRADPAGLLHRSAGPAAQRQPAHHGRLPRHLADAADLRRGAHRNPTLDVGPREARRALVAAFLDHLEHDRGNSIRTRNARLAAIHSLFRFAALAHPEHAEGISRVLAIPPKRFDQALITYLSEPDVDALLAGCDQATWTGRRDHALLLIAVRTGLRISELTGLTRCRRASRRGAHVACHGKGRKDRITPLTSGTVAVLRNWLSEHTASPARPCSPVVAAGTQPRRDRAADHSLRRPGGPSCPSLHEKTVTARVLRHTTAMRLLHAGVDTSVIALWLGTSASTPRRSTSTPT